MAPIEKVMALTKTRQMEYDRNKEKWIVWLESLADLNQEQVRDKIFALEFPQPMKYIPPPSV